MTGIPRGRRNKNDRDLDRLAYLERLGRGPNHGARAAPPTTPQAGPAAAGGGPAIARYARFRQVAGLIFALALLAGLWGVLAIVFTVAALLQGELTIVAGAGRIVAWAFAATAGYGILKGLGEVLLLWADMAELWNSHVELSWRQQQEHRPPGTAD